MTATDFVRELCKLALRHGRPVIAIDFEPATDGKSLQLRFHLKNDHKNDQGNEG